MNKKHYLITGGNTGIGFSTAEALLAAGHRVTITGRDQNKLDKAIDTLKGDAHSVLCDNANFTQIQDFASTLIKQNIHFDGLVLNAGTLYPKMFCDITEEDIDRVFDVNFKGPALMLQALLPTLKNPSSVVFVSSIAACKAFPTGSIYSASKTAFEGLIGPLNLELAPQGIRVNCVRPGITATEILSKAGMSNDEIAHLSQVLAGSPLGRILQPEDISAAIIYLLSDQSIGLRNSRINIEGGNTL